VPTVPPDEPLRFTASILIQVETLPLIQAELPTPDDHQLLPSRAPPTVGSISLSVG